MDSDLIDDDDLKKLELKEIELVDNNLALLHCDEKNESKELTKENVIEKENIEEEFVKEENLENDNIKEETVNELHKNHEVAFSKMKKNKKIKKMSFEKPVNKNNSDIESECQSILKSFEDINLRLDQMDENLDSTVKWVSNICIITILGMIVIVVTMAAAAIIIINKFT